MCRQTKADSQIQAQSCEPVVFAAKQANSMTLAGPPDLVGGAEGSLDGSSEETERMLSASSSLWRAVIGHT